VNCVMALECWYWKAISRAMINGVWSNDGYTTTKGGCYAFVGIGGLELLKVSLSPPVVDMVFTYFAYLHVYKLVGHYDLLLNLDYDY